MSEIVYVSEVEIRREQGPLRTATLPAESDPVKFGVHGAIAEHYSVNLSRLGEVHATTLDYVVAAAGG